jgi:endogenous inhibitor of DNA gyrase (YacG/DUF329 family)
MPRKAALKLRCPICKKAVKGTDSDFPFCSDRCREIDLGKWASGGYVIPVVGDDLEELEMPSISPGHSSDGSDE